VSSPVAVTGETIAHAAAILRSGGVVAFPTETYYGLAVDPLQHRALERLFLIKRRPKNLPILALVTDCSQLTLLASQVPAVYEPLIACFWPGPLTLVFPALATLPSQLTGSTGTIGLRCSPHPVANRLIAAFGSPITATSANLSGDPPATTADEVVRIFGDQIDLVLDGGRTPGGNGSTLVGVRGAILNCLRQGNIPFAAVQACVGPHAVKNEKNAGGING